jgi:hypothetical protein
MARPLVVLLVAIAVVSQWQLAGSDYLLIRIFGVSVVLLSPILKLFWYLHPPFRQDHSPFRQDHSPKGNCFGFFFWLFFRL